MDDDVNPVDERFLVFTTCRVMARPRALPTPAFWESPQARHALAACDGSAADFWAQLVACLHRLDRFERV